MITTFRSGSERVVQLDHWEFFLDRVSVLCDVRTHADLATRTVVAVRQLAIRALAVGSCSLGGWFGVVLPGRSWASSRRLGPWSELAPLPCSDGMGVKMSRSFFHRNSDLELHVGCTSNTEDTTDTAQQDAELDH